MEGIQLSVEKTGIQNSISVIKIGGYIDTTTSSELEHALNTLLKAGSYNIIIDLGNVDYVSSAGWGIFISEIKGIREKGGDLKLVRMIPEVYEVFELLEFHYILKAFDTLEESIKDFERTGTAHVEPLHKSESRKEPQQKKMPGKETTAELSVQEKVKKIISINPDIGTTQIIRTLNSPQYGNIKIGFFKMRRMLKDLGLDSRQKRFELSKTAQD
ncbi:STAS domain-containing protein [candidate division KSB1 bacterium]|nr:STAS domain-containing protein [candidate division KSB1 bacterium]